MAYTEFDVRVLNSRRLQHGSRDGKWLSSVQRSQEDDCLKDEAHSQDVLWLSRVLCGLEVA